MSAPGPWDPGLQPERTALAWRRLGLALTGLAVTLPALAWPSLGPWCLPCAALTLACGFVVLVAAHRRYSRAGAMLRASGGLALDGRLLLLVTVTALILALTGTAAVLTGGPKLP